MPVWLASSTSRAVSVVTRASCSFAFASAAAFQYRALAAAPSALV